MDYSSMHLVLIPLMVPGHLLPMADLGRLLARRNVKVTIVTTPLNAIRIRATIDRDTQSGSPIHIHLLPFPNTQSSLPEGCETIDSLPSLHLHLTNFLNATTLLQKPLQHLFLNLKPAPSAVISDRHIPCVADVAKIFKIPRIIFDGTNCFTLLCNHALHTTKIHEKQNLSDSDSFLVPGLPHRIQFKKCELPESFNRCNNPNTNSFRHKVREAAREAYGVVVNSFQELDAEYVKEYKRVTGQKVWCVGPVSLSNKDDVDKAQRGNEKYQEHDDQYYMKWLDSWPARSVIYVCLGSLNRVTPEQLMELGLGLEATKRPFIWVLRGAYKKEEMENLLMEDGLEERVRGRGVLIRGWVPQILILSHIAIGAFLTHCGWNSTLEGICSGVPMVTFPLFSEQFFNEKIVVEVVGTGVRVGAQNVVAFGEEEKFGVQVRRENVKEAIEKVMGESEESESVRERARKYAEKAKMAMEKGGSSYLNMSLLIEDILQHVKRLNQYQDEPPQQEQGPKAYAQNC